MALILGPTTALRALAHTAFLEYIPFILHLLALFTVAGGILVRGNIHGAPGINTALLTIGVLLGELHRHDGSLYGDDPPGAAGERRPAAQRTCGRVLHFLVSNIGGSLTPLGTRHCS